MDLVGVSDDWLFSLAPLISSPEWRKLESIIQSERSKTTVVPPSKMVFRALKETPLSSVRTVILGQDPYHGEGQAEGLAFSVRSGVRKPPSLKNILKELSNDVGCAEPTNGSLARWADQGVLLLNSILTVRLHEPGSHRNIGWEQVTDHIIMEISRSRIPTAFLLWGAHAQKKRSLIDLSVHFVQESVHPSPLSAHRGFFGSKPFTKANEFLDQNGRGTISWALAD